MAKTQKQRSAEFRARKAENNLHEVRGIYAHSALHDYIKRQVLLTGLSPQLKLATKRAKEKA